MADKIKVWFDAEADFLEVRFSDDAGYENELRYRETVCHVTSIATHRLAIIRVDAGSVTRRLAYRRLSRQSSTRVLVPIRMHVVQSQANVKTRRDHDRW